MPTPRRMVSNHHQALHNLLSSSHRSSLPFNSINHHSLPSLSTRNSHPSSNNSLPSSSSNQALAIQVCPSIPTISPSPHPLNSKAKVDQPFSLSIRTELPNFKGRRRTFNKVLHYLSTMDILALLNFTMVHLRHIVRDLHLHSSRISSSLHATILHHSTGECRHALAVFHLRLDSHSALLLVLRRSMQWRCSRCIKVN